jgi:hypothetical protein
MEFVLEKEKKDEVEKRRRVIKNNAPRYNVVQQDSAVNTAWSLRHNSLCLGSFVHNALYHKAG